MSEADWKNINALRLLAADTVDKANSGHPGAPLGMAPMAYVLFTKFIKQNPLNPQWINRDRFILSNGHACALQYALLHLTGNPAYTIEDLKQFRQVDSKTPGHPECHFPGIEVCTGPLGQGISNAVGIAIGEAHSAAVFNKPDFTVIDHYTYVFCGDGCLQEGVSSEAGSIAGHLGLGNYDDNHITIDGETELSFSEDVLARYAAYGWHTQHVKNGDTDLDGIAAAIANARNEKNRPSMIRVTTTIGFGSAQQGTRHVHGEPLKKDDLAGLKKKWGFDPAQNFAIPDDVRAAFNQSKTGQGHENNWQLVYSKYQRAYPDLAADFQRRLRGELPKNWEAALPRYTPKDAAQATRKYSQSCINALAKIAPELVGGSADLNPSCFTYLDCSTDFLKGKHAGFGVREHAMCAIVNGLAAYGGPGYIIPFGSTFLNFIGYALGAVTLSALSGFKALFIMTHDSIGLGEDGPTHQAVEKFMLIRSTPNILFLRPGDGNETSGAYIAALRQKHRPSVLALSRQGCPNVEGTSVEGVLKGAYVVQDSDAGSKPDVILVGTGSELALCATAKDKLKGALKVRLVSFPSWELFGEQTRDYQESVFIPGVPVISVEAGTIHGWTKYAHGSIGMTTFGASGPAPKVYAKFGITVENIVEKSKLAVDFYKHNPVPHLLARPWAHL